MNFNTNQMETITNLIPLPVDTLITAFIVGIVLAIGLMAIFKRKQTKK